MRRARTQELGPITRAEARELDRRAIEELGIPSMVLMESAGRACADAALEMLGDANGNALCVCGPGQNGGDGLVVARTLRNRGQSASVFYVGAREGLERSSADVRLNAQLWERLGGRIELVPDGWGGLPEALASAAIVVDALFGTGLSRELRDPFAGVVRAIEASGRPVLAVDVPSGLDADTGAVLGEAVRATRTVTFVAPKVGFGRGEGPERCGEIVVAEIGIPRGLPEGG